MVYTNLPPGDYRFDVMAANDDGVWSSRPASIAVRQEAFFHQTPWFYALCGAIAMALAVAYVQWRRRVAMAEMKVVLTERGRIARELHDTVAQGLAAVQLQLQSAERAAARDDEVLAHLRRAEEVTAGSTRDVRVALAELHAHELREELLDEALQRFADGALSGLPVACVVTVEGKPRQLRRAVHTELQRIAQEAMMNAARHANAKRIDVTVTYSRRHVAVRIRDDGNGASHAENAAGYGVAGMRERAARIRAQFELAGTPGNGTEVFVRAEA